MFSSTKSSIHILQWHRCFICKIMYSYLLNTNAVSLSIQWKKKVWELAGWTQWVQNRFEFVVWFPQVFWTFDLQCLWSKVNVCLFLWTPLHELASWPRPTLFNSKSRLLSLEGEPGINNPNTSTYQSLLLFSVFSDIWRLFAIGKIELATIWCIKCSLKISLFPSMIVLEVLASYFLSPK